MSVTEIFVKYSFRVLILFIFIVVLWVTGSVFEVTIPSVLVPSTPPLQATVIGFTEDVPESYIEGLILSTSTESYYTIIPVAFNAHEVVATGDTICYSYRKGIFTGTAYQTDLWRCK
jgi:hypothetical protein